MYQEYFGLREPCFSITPDPHYLFLSREHREALAHLLYGAGEGGGFVLLTGEVGTGKTTICRTFLEQLPNQVDAALILNPALTVPELLHVICDEFGIELPAGVISTKKYVDRLNDYLLQAHAQGRRPVLMIDEAQNLRPEVLEQIRLLTNLETYKHKLLQIFLIGQPELRELLGQKQLRQLAQRITARFHLMPLSKIETGNYIRHRLAVAGAEYNLFTPSAVRRIFTISGGVPRLINILCDRSLLGAYATKKRIVDRKIVVKANRELKGERYLPGRQRLRGAFRMAMLLVLLFISIGWLFTERDEVFQSIGGMINAIDVPQISESVKAAESLVEIEDVGREKTIAAVELKSEPKPEKIETTGKIVPSKIATEVISPIASQEEERITTQPTSESKSEYSSELPGLDKLMMDRRTAMTLLLGRWKTEYSALETAEPCLFAEGHGLQCREYKGSWNSLISYDRPVLISLSDDQGPSGFAVVIGLGQKQAILDLGESRVRVPLTQLDSYWSGDFLLVWRPPSDKFTIIGPDSSSESVRWLRKLLATVPGSGIENNGSALYVPELQTYIQRFQGHRGLLPDGIVGPETLLQLNTVAALPGTPSLDRLP